MTTKLDYDLIDAAAHNNIDDVRKCLDLGANMYAENSNAMRWAASRGYTDIVALLIDRGLDFHTQEEDALCWAADRGHTETVRLLLDRGANIHARDDYALRKAVEQDHVETVDLLLKNGANVYAHDNAILRWAASNAFAFPRTADLIEKHVAELKAENKKAFNRACRHGTAATSEQADEIDEMTRHIETIKPKLDGLFKPRKPATKPG